jgi:hypothetical protein
MGWDPSAGFLDYDWRGFNEAMLLYVLAIASPTSPLDPSAWREWTSTYNWGRFHGQEHVNFAPLFGHQYSHLFVDFRGIQDDYMRRRGIDYFENSRRATYSQRAYAMANPDGWQGYGDSLWGLTASDGPADTTLEIFGRRRRFMEYAARGAALDEIRDDGTIAPTAAGGSLPFAPEIALPALVTMREAHGEALFGEYGFLDAFNQTWPAGFRRTRVTWRLGGGMTTTISASTRGRSSSWQKTTARISSGGTCGSIRRSFAGCGSRGFGVDGWIKPRQRNDVRLSCSRGVSVDHLNIRVRRTGQTERRHHSTPLGLRPRRRGGPAADPRVRAPASRHPSPGAADPF